MTVTRTYTGPLRSGTVALPTRHVRFVAGEPVEFTAAEAELLDPAEWAASVIDPGGRHPGEAIAVPADGTMAELVVPDIAAMTITQVLEAVANSPERAAAALDMERAGRNRARLVAKLTAISDTIPADQANTTEEA